VVTNRSAGDATCEAMRERAGTSILTRHITLPLVMLIALPVTRLRASTLRGS